MFSFYFEEEVNVFLMETVDAARIGRVSVFMKEETQCERRSDFQCSD